MDNGRIIESGNHAALMARGGVYAQLVRGMEAEDAPLPPDAAGEHTGAAETGTTPLPAPEE